MEMQEMGEQKHPVPCSSWGSFFGDHGPGVGGKGHPAAPSPGGDGLGVALVIGPVLADPPWQQAGVGTTP